MNKLAQTDQPSLRFLNLISGQVVDSVWSELLDQRLWRSAKFSHYEENVLSGFRNRTPWKSVIFPWITIEPGMLWSRKTHSLNDPVHRPSRGAGSISDFLNAAERVFRRYHGRRIAVQLSGGLDSSLIIGLLRHFDIPHCLVGLRSKRYEFRTERRVQEKLVCRAESVEFIHEDAHLPCSDLPEIPPHQVPDLLSLNFSQDYAMALACRRLGVEVFFSGGGGDNLLAEAVPECADLCEWRPQIFTDPFPVDIVYRPLGIEFLSFFGDLGIVDAIYRLRCGQERDLTKLWARHFFKEFLPSELVEFAYCADFWGRDMDGMQDAIASIREMHSFAAEVTGSDYFADEKLEELLKQDLMRPDKTLYQRLEVRISASVWVNALERLLTNLCVSEK
jgi:hypothetical protein